MNAAAAWWARLRRQWKLYHLGEPEFAFMFEPPPPGEWVALDCETTGLNPRTDEIVSIGAVRIVGERILTSERLELLVRPEKGVTADSVRIHRLRERDLAGGIPRATLNRLAAAVTRRHDSFADPRLQEVLDQIELRAHVELAKLEQLDKRVA